MKFLCLIYSEREKLSQEEFDAIVADYVAFTEWIKDSGHHLASDALEPIQKAKTVRVRNGKMSATDGPFAETKEQLGGFFLIEAKDMDEAVQIGAKIPGAKWGSIEVRPIREI